MGIKATVKHKHYRNLHHNLCNILDLVIEMALYITYTHTLPLLANVKSIILTVTEYFESSPIWCENANLVIPSLNCSSLEPPLLKLFIKWTWGSMISVPIGLYWLLLWVLFLITRCSNNSVEVNGVVGMQPNDCVTSSKVSNSMEHRLIPVKSQHFFKPLVTQKRSFTEYTIYFLYFLKWFVSKCHSLIDWNSESLPISCITSITVSGLPAVECGFHSFDVESYNESKKKTT